MTLLSGWIAFLALAPLADAAQKPVYCKLTIAGRDLTLSKAALKWGTSAHVISDESTDLWLMVALEDLASLTDTKFASVVAKIGKGEDVISQLHVPYTETVEFKLLVPEHHATIHCSSSEL